MPRAVRCEPDAAAGRPASISIIVPMLDEALVLPGLLAHLTPFRQRGCEILLVDGGSRDDTVGYASAQGFRVLTSARGRARQMNAGVGQARGDILLFLHADTLLPDHADARVRQALASATTVWGRFDVHITGRSPWLGVVAWFMNRRSRLSGIATGDQAMFVARGALAACGGVPDQPLMEDIELSRRLRRMSRPACLVPPVLTSGRRWETRGVWRTILLMWRLRLAYALGTPAERLADRYR
ncbi:MAG: TIGR04283 family arsenosugar biosynthesis glycosyltransferase [Panacagrimonas sp.]